MQGIEQQFLALQKGFNELIPQTLLKPFDERELELVSAATYLPTLSTRTDRTILE